MTTPTCDKGHLLSTNNVYRTTAGDYGCIACRMSRWYTDYGLGKEDRLALLHRMIEARDTAIRQLLQMLAQNGVAVGIRIE